MGNEWSCWDWSNFLNNWSRCEFRVIWLSCIEEMICFLLTVNHNSLQWNNIKSSLMSTWTNSIMPLMTCVRSEKERWEIVRDCKETYDELWFINKRYWREWRWVCCYSKTRGDVTRVEESVWEELSLRHLCTIVKCLIRKISRHGTYHLCEWRRDKSAGLRASEDSGWSNSLHNRTPQPLEGEQIPDTTILLVGRDSMISLQ